jgi:hypothetical protein
MGLSNYLSDWPQTSILLIAASQVARITGVNHRPLAPLLLFFFFSPKTYFNPNYFGIHLFKNDSFLLSYQMKLINSLLSSNIWSVFKFLKRCLTAGLIHLDFILLCVLRHNPNFYIFLSGHLVLSTPCVKKSIPRPIL